MGSKLAMKFSSMSSSEGEGFGEGGSGGEEEGESGRFVLLPSVLFVSTDALAWLFILFVVWKLGLPGLILIGFSAGGVVELFMIC